MPTAVRCCWRAPSGRLRKGCGDRRERSPYQRRRAGSSARGSILVLDIRSVRGSSLFFLQGFRFLWARENRVCYLDSFLVISRSMLMFTLSATTTPPPSRLAFHFTP